MSVSGEGHAAPCAAFQLGALATARVTCDNLVGGCMEAAAASETGMQGWPDETELPEAPPEPWSFALQQEDGQLYIRVFQSSCG